MSWNRQRNIKGPMGSGIADPSTINELDLTTAMYNGVKARWVSTPTGVEIQLQNSAGTWIKSTDYSIPSGIMPPPPPQATGLAYLPKSRIVENQVLLSQWTDIVVVGAAWCDIEQVAPATITSPGTYNFNSTAVTGNPQSLKAQLDLVNTANVTRVANGWNPLKVRISLLTSASWDASLAPGNPGFKPAWLRALALTDSRTTGKFFWFTDNSVSGGGVLTELLVFWDPTFLDRVKMLAVATQAWLTANGYTSIVFAIDVPIMGSSNNDWNPGDLSAAADDPTGTLDKYPGGPGDAPGQSFATSPQGRWANCLVGSGYPTFADAIIATGNRMISDYAAAFGSIKLCSSIDRIPPTPGTGIGAYINPPTAGGGGGSLTKGGNVAIQVMKNAKDAYGSRIVAMKWKLAGGAGVPSGPVTDINSSWYDLTLLQQYGLLIALQAVWTCYGDTTGGCATTSDMFYCQRMNQSGGSCQDSTLMFKNAIDKCPTFAALWAEMYRDDLWFLGGVIANADTHPPPLTDLNMSKYAHNALYIPPS